MASCRDEGECSSALRDKLHRKEQELKGLQQEFDEYRQSSHDLEQELEQELSRLEECNARLLSNNQYLGQDLVVVRGKLEEALDQIRRLEDELQVIRGERQVTLQSRRELEQKQDDLETQVRVLQATVSDLRHKLEREMEEKVFLINDHEELQRENELALERYRAEIMDVKSELYALQQKYEDVKIEPAMRVTRNDRMSMTRGRSGDCGDCDSMVNENPMCLPAIHKRDEISHEKLIDLLRLEIGTLLTTIQGDNELRTTAEAGTQHFCESHAQNEAVKSEVNDIANELIERDHQIRNRNEYIEELRNLLHKLLSQMVSARSSGIKFSSEYERMRRDVGAKDNEINKLEKELNTVKLQWEYLAQNERQLMAHLDAAKITADEQRGEIVSLNQIFEKSKQQRSELEKKLQSDEVEILQYRKEVEQLNCINMDLQERLDKAVKQVAEMECASARKIPSVSGKEVTEPKSIMIETQTWRSSFISSENLEMKKQDGTSPFALSANGLSADMLRVQHTPEQLARKYLDERIRNASLLSRLQTVCGNIQVFCRVRPIIVEEQDKSWGSKLAVNVVNQSDLVAMDVRHDNSPNTGYGERHVIDMDMESVGSNRSWSVFTFDRILGPEEDQSDVFREVEPIAQSVVDGFKACIFAYGQTGSGKTYTMEGTPADPGLNYRVISHLFQSIRLRGAIYTPRTENNTDPDDEMSDSYVPNESAFTPIYRIQVGVLEIYNDSLRDLINTSNSKALEIRHDATTGDICVPTLTMETVVSPHQTIDILRNAQKNRVTERTNSNSRSSRSHCIVIVQIFTRSPQNSTDRGAVEVEEEAGGKLYLVDLAGSERVKKSEVSGEMLRQAAYINKSLSALADVMEALDKKVAHVPYRNSKLTFLLQDVLNSSCKTIMIVNIGPTIENASETYRSLQLAQRVRNIVVGRNNIVKNKDILSAKKAVGELQSLKQQMRVLKRKYAQSELSVAALKSDQRNQAEKHSVVLNNQLRAWEVQNESIKIENESLKRLVDDLKTQIKETKKKEGISYEGSHRFPHHHNAKNRVYSSPQEMLHIREEEIKRLRQLLTEARRRCTSALCPGMSSQQLASTINFCRASSPTSNQQESDGLSAAGESSSSRSPISLTCIPRAVCSHSPSRTLSGSKALKSKPPSSLGVAKLSSARKSSRSRCGAWK